MKNQLTAALAALLIAPLATVAMAQQATPPQPTAASTAQYNANPSRRNANAMDNGANASAMDHGAGTNGTASPTKIEQKVKHALTSHGVTATNVNVAFSDGTATLTGTVFNQQDITKAKQAAMRVRGVKRVDTSGLQARRSTKRPSGNG